MSGSKMKCAVIGSGNIGTDLLIKAKRTSELIEITAMVGIDPESDGLARAERMGVATTSDGIDGLVAMNEFADMNWSLTPRRRALTLTTTRSCASTANRSSI